jgi:hypothetical protein
LRGIENDDNIYGDNDNDDDDDDDADTELARRKIGAYFSNFYFM